MTRYPPVLVLLLTAACGGRPATQLPAPGAEPPAMPAEVPADRTAPAPQPLLPPQFAMLAGLMPLRSIGADQFVASHPTYDGRGVIIAILDSGVDAGVPGLRTTTSGEEKLLDLRDFSGEGRVPLTPTAPDGDLIAVGAHLLEGFGRIARLARPPYFGGLFRERPLGALPGSDVNGDGDNADVFPVIVARASDGWFVVADTDGDGSLEDEQPVRDYALHHETFAWGPLTIAANLEERDGAPTLDLFFDNSGHGTHVAGIAAGHNLFGLEGFNGVAPGARLAVFKISNNARGGISVTGSMARAMARAAELAEGVGLPLVVNLSFGVGNEGAAEGSAAIDSIVDAFALAHPEVLFVISAGNDGPGISTVGFPGSAQFALTACALFPGVFAQPPQPGVRPADDVVGWWSSRGGEVQKPDLCAPGVAFSNVPPWQTGQEVSGGTSMAAPQLAGAAALLQSGLVQLGRRGRAVDLKRALIATAKPIAGASVIDVGTGIADVPAAFRWLRAAHQPGRYAIRALPVGGNSSGAAAAYRRAGLASPADTVQPFSVAPVRGQPHTKLLLRPDAAWLRAPATLEFAGNSATVTVRYDAAQLTEPGLHVGTVWALPATDTLGGAAFGLTSTVIVPHWLAAAPVADRRRITSGGQYRYFLDVPSGGGLHLSISVSDPGETATLYLFEPTGQPHRGTASLEVGGDAGRTATLQVRADDVVPGVYEAVVVAAPLSGVTYALSAGLPAVAVTGIAGDSAVLEGRDAQTRVHAELAGTVRTWKVRGTGDEIRTIPVTAPAWAGAMVVDVQLPQALWPAFTDFGVSVFDSTGQLVSDGPLNYAFGRQEIALGEVESRSLVVELFPAWALANPGAVWEAVVRVNFLSGNPTVLLDALTAVEERTRVPLGPVPSGAPEQPADGFLPLVRVSATDAAGRTSERLGPARLLVRSPGASP